MKLTENTILITGGGSGIGRALAEAFHALGNQVVIAGRRQHALDETTAANPGMKSLTLNIEDPASIRAVAARLASDFPKLNVLINNAGAMKFENLLAAENNPTESNSPESTAAAAETTASAAEIIVATNLLGPIRLTAALLPLLRKQPASTIMNVSSGLAFVPMAVTPTYCATKAALHSYTLSLRYQLKATTTEVIELIPPYVQTHLMGDRQAADPRAMPLDKFIAEVMQILKSQPAVKEICVETVKPLRFAAESGNFETAFNGMNDAMAGTF